VGGVEVSKGTNFMTENMTTFLTDNIVQFLDWVVLVIRWIRDSIRESPSIKPYRGGEPILRDAEVMKVQPEMVKKFGEKKALILQKFHEWVQVNERKGTHNHDDVTWTAGSYTYWHKQFFGWFSLRHLKSLIKELEDEGLLIWTTDAKFCYGGRKAYRLDYARILAYEPSKKATVAIEEDSLCGGNNVETPVKDVHPNNIVISKRLHKALMQIETPTTPYTRAQKKIGNEKNSDVVDVVEKSNHDSGEYVGLGDAVREQVNRDGTDEMSAPTASQVSTAETPPSSAAPPSGLVKDLEHVGMLSPTAHDIVKRYPEEKVQGALAYVKANSLDNPPGWIVWALATNAVPEIAVAVDYTGKGTEWEGFINY
jgi:hypothetical protein